MGYFVSKILTQAEKILQHTYRLFESTYGYVLFCATMIAGFISGEQVVCTLIGLAILFDLVLGICTAIMNKKFVLSDAIRDTFIKIIVYGIPLLLIGLTENKLAGTNIGFYAICAIAIACELWSITAHLLILAPNMPFLKILRFQLKGEIESKTGKNIEELTKKEDEAK